MGQATSQVGFGNSRIEKAVSLLAGPTTTGRAFFETAVQALSAGLGCTWAVIGELAETRDAVDVIAFWNGDELADPFSYSLASGPCEVVYRTKRSDVHHFYPEGVTELFPKFELLKALGAQAYRGELFFGSDGNPAGHVVALMDQREADSPEVRALFRLITQRAGAEYKRWKLEDALAKSEKRYRNLIETLPDSVILHRDGVIVFANGSAAEALGAADPTELIGYPAIQIVHPDDRKRIGERIRRVMEDGEVVRNRRQRYQRLDGTWFPGESSGARIDCLGGPAAMVVFRDVTERLQLEEQLHQAQKLDAIGQLTGGIAHDFNNLLMVIKGNMEFMTGDSGDREARAAIFRATDRGAELTDRLLAFARRQTLVARPIQLAAELDDLSILIKRAIGEEITVEVKAPDDCWPVFVDAGQLENAILNLALNARDAMPDGGTLTIECRNSHLNEDELVENPEAEAGDHLLLTVTDTGVGMDSEIRKQAFEPFFTTRDVGKGSGLGLSMVHGFVRQSGGHTIICSEPGQGTTVKVYLPRSDVSPAGEAGQSCDEVPQGRGEMILVIEDNCDVRQMTAKLLKRLGYRVIDVAEAASALSVMASGEKIDLVLSDVVLPGGMSGPEFASEWRGHGHDLKIIFVSGYPAEATKHIDFLNGESLLLNKPYPRHRLAKMLRQLLD